MTYFLVFSWTVTFKKTVFFQGVGKRAPGKGKAVGEGNRTEALEAIEMMRGPWRAEPGLQGETGLATVDREPNSNPEDPLDSASSKVRGNFPSLAPLMN